jgi:hypothetical protein
MSESMEVERTANTSWLPTVTLNQHPTLSQILGKLTHYIS